MKKTNSMTIKKMETGNAEILTDGENAARAGAKPQIKIYREYNIREQIAAGGAGDWQIRIRKYTVSLRYVNEAPKGNSLETCQLVTCPRQRLVAIVYKDTDGISQAIYQIATPAKGAHIATDNATFVKLFGYLGRLCGLEVSSDKGMRFIGGKWGRIAQTQPITPEEHHRGITQDTQRWVCVKNNY